MGTDEAAAGRQYPAGPQEHLDSVESKTSNPAVLTTGLEGFMDIPSWMSSIGQEVLVDTFDPRTQEAEGGGLLSSGVYRASSNAANATQRNPALKQQQQQD